MKRIYLLIVSIVCLLMVSCKKDVVPVPPEIKINNIVAQLTSVSIKGEYIFEGEIKNIYIIYGKDSLMVDTETRKMNIVEKNISVDIEGLTMDTRYYYQIQCVNKYSRYTCEIASFTTLGLRLATVTTNDVTDITTNSASCGGDVTFDGNSTVTSRGVCWGTKPNPTTSDKITVNGKGTGTFTSRLSNLTAETTYYVRAYAINEKGTAYGEERSFKTLAIALPTVTTNDVTDITISSASCGGNVTDGGGADVTARGICWSTKPNPTINDEKTTNGSGTGYFPSNLTNLTGNTTYYVRAYATNEKGTAYGEERVFETFDEVALPTVTTNNVTNITATSASCGGNVTSDGGFEVTARGICWSTSPNPTINDNKTNNGRGTGTFTSNLTNLAEKTTYYVRAYATNGKGTSYGEEKIFTTLELSKPTVTTRDVTNITLTTATCGGNVTYSGGREVTARGVCWSTNPNPTINDNKTTDGSGTGSFTSNLINLTENTTYYVRAYATNEKGTSYGEVKSFTTSVEISQPTVTTNNVTNITSSSATCGGNVTSDGNGTITARGVCWSEYPNPTIDDNKTTDGSGSGNFTSNLINLTENTTYYVRAYATNEAGTSYGEEKSFTTLVEISQPTVTTKDVTNITSSSATCGGNVTSDGNATITACGICWSEYPNPTIYDNIITYADSISFTSNLINLTANTTYYVRAYATNEAGTSYGEEKSFTTLVEISQPTVTTNNVTNITSSSATCGGNVTSDGNATVTSRGVCWSTSPNPTIYDNITTDGSGIGTFTSNLINLTSNTTYYVRAYATNEKGTSYGEEKSFTTLVEISLPTVTTSNVITNITTNSATCGGNVTFDGNTTVTSRGICWSEYPNPTINDNKTTDGSGKGSFTSTLINLTENTTYYVRAYATNEKGTSYGEERSFTTLKNIELPTVTTYNISSITQTTANCGGYVTSDGNGTITARGVCWSTSSNPTIDDNKTTDGSGVGTFASNLINLTANTTYYVRAYATNEKGTCYGEEKMFTTLFDLPTVVTYPVTDYTETTATLYGNVVADGGAEVISRGFCWNISPNPTIYHNHNVEGSGNGEFSSSITNLDNNTTYYVRAYATNEIGTSYGEQITFKTLEININGYAYVDLGLPSGLKWATCNIGASSPEEYGDYFAWGETNTKSSYRDSNSVTLGQQMGDISGNPQYDAARANWGATWRLPTRTECLELLEKCTWIWTTQGGVSGYKVKGPNGNYIFLPAAGLMSISTLTHSGRDGYHWCSTPNDDSVDDKAYNLSFVNSDCSAGLGTRSVGRSIRPVSE